MLFKYKAIDNSGKEVSGSIDVDDRDTAINSLQKSGLVIIEISGGSSFRNVTIFSKRVSIKDIYILSRQLTTLFKVSIPVYRALVLTATQTENETLRNILYEVSNDVKKGTSISSAFAKHPQFSKFFVSMIAVGEESGTLINSFETLAEYYERAHELTSKVKGALVYPLFVIFTFLGVLWFLLGFVIPQIIEVLLSSGSELPVITEIVINLSNFVKDNSIILFFVIFAFIFLLYRYIKTPVGIITIDTLKLRIPLIGRLFVYLYISRLSMLLGVLLGSGVRLLRATEIAADTVENHVYNEILKDANTKLKNGIPLSSVFAMHGEYIPKILTQMVRIGEETGHLSEMMKSISMFFERNLQTTVETLIKLIEPILLVVLGVLVATLLVSVLLPVYNLSGQL